MVKWDESVVLRSARLDDCQRTMELLAREGLAVPTEPAAARRSWDWLWRRNPALASGGDMPPLGWVLEREDRIVGFFGNIPRRYHYDGRELLVGVGTSWAVEQAFRTRARDMAAAWFAQEAVDLVLATTASRSAGRILSRLSAVPMPQTAYRQVLYWVLDADHFLRAALRKKDVRRKLAAAAGIAFSPALTTALVVQGRRPGRMRAGMEPEVIRLRDVGDAFDDLWSRKRREGPRLYARRSAEDLRWHFEPGAEAGTVTFICCRRHGRLEGYLVLVRVETPEIGLVRGKVADLVVASDDPQIVDALLAAGYERGRQGGCHVLELLGLPTPIRCVAERSRPFTRTLPTQPFIYKARSPELEASLRTEDAWYPSAYDGDTTLV